MLGLTFKPNTDDMRDAPVAGHHPGAAGLGAKVQAFDPEGHEARQLLPGVDFKADPYEAAEGADALVILTEWDQFRALDLDRVKGPCASRWWSTCATSTGPRDARPRLRLRQRRPALTAGASARRCVRPRRSPSPPG